MSKTDQKRLIRFACSCGNSFQKEPDRIAENPDRPSHPWDYFATCDDCGDEAPQIYWERNLMSAWPNATGPKTEEGKARTRFNSMTHGLTAKTASFYPAKPGRYPSCTGCEYLNSDKTELSDCVPQNACLKRAELYLQHLIAFKNGDPSMLRDHRALLQANLTGLADDMIRQIIEDGGPRIMTAEWYSDKDGGFHLARYKDEKTNEYVQIYKVEAHPLLKPLMDMLTKNKMSLEDLGMTPKVQEEEAAMRGGLEAQRQNADAIEDFMDRQKSQQEMLLRLIKGPGIHDGKVIDGETVDG